MMPKERFEVDPAKYDVSRRRFLRNAGMAAASVPFLGTFTEVLTERGASAQSFRDSNIPMFAHHPGYRFTFVNHVTTNSFFTAYGIQDAARLLGIPVPQWTGSQNSIVSEMVSSMNTAIAGNVNGIAVALIDPVAFNTPTNNALAKGIPVLSYNADEPGNNRMAYIGQNNLTAGAAAAERIVNSGLVKKGDLVGMIIATPGSGNIQPRIDGALPIFKKAGYVTTEVAGGATQTPELAAVEAWYLGHKDVKFMYTVDSGDSIAVATTIKKHSLQGKVGGSGWDVGVPVLQEVQSGGLLFSIDQQAYLQGFVPTVQLFLYAISAGLMKPCDTDTGLGYVTKATVGAYLQHKTRFEGSGSAETAFTAPKKIG
jgi:simple sugar transport system substrate-binding protein